MFDKIAFVGKRILTSANKVEFEKLDRTSLKIIPLAPFFAKEIARD